MSHCPAQDRLTHCFVVFWLGLGMLSSLSARRSEAQPPASNSAANAIPIVVSDFELYTIPPKPKKNGKQVAPRLPAKPESKSEAVLIYPDTEEPPDQAHRLVDYFAMTLLQTLQGEGFQEARRGGKLPAGAQIRGVFAEADAQNRIRRSILGAGSPNGKFLLYVGVFNMARDPQPLYQLATEQPESREYGPVITLNSYIPLVKYELDKNPTEEDVQKICKQIAGSLQQLLQANPMGFSQ